ncbi:MAG: hypothetical protein WCX79_00050 [Candidatus Paceibacterota bacterium]|jgi:hypothetical protein
MAKFKVTKSKKLDRWHVNGGKIRGKYVKAIDIMNKDQANEVAAARNRLANKYMVN